MMIRRLKRQTKKRHSIRRRWPGEPFGMRPIDPAKWGRFLDRMTRGKPTITVAGRRYGSDDAVLP